MYIPFDNTYANLPTHFYQQQAAEPVSNPALIAWNSTLASELGIVAQDDGDIAGVFSGNQDANGSAPLAQAYSGHQFGHFNPQLGDGRALLLGEVIDQAGTRRDIQLKGSGRTPFSRRGDGRAWLGPVLREYLVSEAMHAIGIPTTRALAAVSSGECVYRETILPGAVLTRVAGSHLRVGSFQYFAHRRDIDGLKTLFTYARDRHYPQAETPLDFLNCVMAAQARLIAKWMGVGFIHGVMNTDNCSISGETIDYGPCAFMDAYHPMCVFSSIDQHARYAYANQPDVIVWNMAQLATSLVPLMPDAEEAVKVFTQAVHAMPQMIQKEWEIVFAAKLGIAKTIETDAQLARDLLTISHSHELDFTILFHNLTNMNECITEADNTDLNDWLNRWHVETQGRRDPNLIQQSNPAVIPRNHQVEAVITAAVNGNFAPFHEMLCAVTRPYEPNVEFMTAPKAHEVVQATFCGT
jgi:uncharacterized protein YdiU (UPF0061 family)